MQISLKLVESSSEIQRLILNEIKAELNDVLRGSAIYIQTQIQTLFADRIMRDATWISLQSGKLKAEFGIPSDGDSRLNAILKIWLDNIIMDYKPVVGISTLKGGLVLKMLTTNWVDVISSEAANITTNKRQILPWLEWLLINGDKIIIKEYEVRMTNSPRSRSGMALMVKRGRWRVPPEFSGTTNNNFVTKILDELDVSIADIIGEELSNRMN